MISTKLSAIVAIAAFAAGSLFAPPVQQAIAAVIATDVQCTGCVGNSDVAGNAITAAKIKDGEVKAAEIAADAVGGSELQGVSKLLFGVCGTSEFNNAGWANNAWNIATCNINGAAVGDNVVAFLNGNNINQCYAAISSWVVSSNTVKVLVRGDCTTSQIFNTAATISVIVYHK